MGGGGGEGRDVEYSQIWATWFLRFSTRTQYPKKGIISALVVIVFPVTCAAERKTNPMLDA